MDRDKEIRSLQDYSGKIAAGSIVAWAEETGKELNSVSPEDIEAYRQWADAVNPFHPVYDSQDFKRCLGWLDDPSFAEEALELYHLAETKDTHGT